MTYRASWRRAAACVFVLGLGAMAPAGAAEAQLKPWPAKQSTPGLKLADLEGKEWDLASLRGKVVLVNFWASWCGPCVEELPVLNALAERHKDGLVVVGVNYKESLDAIERFRTAHPFAYPVVRDRSGEMFRQWTSGVMPATILVDRQGRARWRLTGELGPDDDKLRQAIDGLLAEQERTTSKR